jgi:hypothetical protein
LKETIGAYLPAAAEIAAGALSAASAGVPAAFKPLAATAGALWTGSGVTSAATNASHSKVEYVAAGMNTIAGGTQLASAFVSGAQYVPVAAASAAAWGVNALTHIGKTSKALYDGQGHQGTHIAKGVGSVLNLGGAVAAGAGAYLTATGGAGAVPAALASGALWSLGAASQGMAGWSNQRRSDTDGPEDLEAGVS